MGKNDQRLVSEKSPYPFTTHITQWTSITGLSGIPPGETGMISGTFSLSATTSATPPATVLRQ